MCLTKVYYNTYADGAQDISEKAYPCRDGRGCSRPDVRKYDRKFPFSKLGDSLPESHRSLSERKPTPYFEPHTPRGSKSPSPSRKRDSDMYMSGTKSSKHRDYYDPYSSSYDPYDYHRSSSRRDPRDRDRYEREPRLKRSSTLPPQIVYMDRDDAKSSRSRSRSSSRDYSRDIPLGLVPLADEYGRRRHSISGSRSHSREGSSSRDGSDHYYRRRTDDPHGYMFIDDQDERRRQRRQERTARRSSFTEPSSSAAMKDYDLSSSSRYLPRRASTVVHHSDGSVSTGSGSGSGSSSRPKQLRWLDQVRAKQNAEIASRPIPGIDVEPKGILKHGGESKSKGRDKGKGREMDDIAELRRAVERMEIPRGRDREPRRSGGRDEWDYAGRYGVGGYGDEVGGRRKRSKVWSGDDRYY